MDLKSTRATSERIALSSFQNKEWSFEVKKPTPAMMPRYPPVENATFMAMAIKGEISQHLFELATSYRVDELSVMSKPTKAVTATIKFPKWQACVGAFNPQD